MAGLILGKYTVAASEPLLVVQIVVLTTVQALVMVTGAVVVSSQTTSTRAANLLASFIIIPMSMLVMLESMIMVQPHQRYLLWYIIVGLLVTVMLLVRMGARIFNREELLGRSLDQLNLRWAWRIFWAKFRGPDRRSFHAAALVSAERLPGACVSCAPRPSVVLICIVAAFIGGWIAAGVWPSPLDQFNANDETLMDHLQTWLEWGQNNPQLDRVRRRCRISACCWPRLSWRSSRLACWRWCW